MLVSLCVLVAACDEPGPLSVNVAGTWSNVQGGIPAVTRLTLTDHGGTIAGYARTNSTPDSVSVSGTRDRMALTVVVGFRNPATFTGRVWAPDAMTLYWDAVSDSATFRKT